MNFIIQLLEGAATGGLAVGLGLFINYVWSLRDARKTTKSYRLEADDGHVIATVTLPSHATEEEKEKAVDEVLTELGYGRPPVTVAS